MFDTLHLTESGDALEGICMLDGFNVYEIFEMALGIEKQGKLFYTRASEIFDDPQVRSMLAELASMEACHERIFLSMREDLTKDELYSSGFDPDDLAASYLRAMTSGVVFDVIEPLTGKETLRDVLRKGIEAEKDSIVFYTGLKVLVPEVLGREKIDRIIEEEMRHIVLLSKQLSLCKDQKKGDAKDAGDL